MRRIINGMTYDTKTSVRLARRRRGKTNEETIETLYQNRRGAFFTVTKRTRHFLNEDQTLEARSTRTFKPIDADAAHAWMMDGEVRVFENPFGDPPEAEGETKGQAIINVRMQAPLKRAIEKAARAQHLSGNAWATQCLHRCLGKTSWFDLDMAPLVRKLLDGDHQLAECFQNAKGFWKAFFDQHSNESAAVIATELGQQERVFGQIFAAEYGREFGKQMMPLTCLKWLYEEKPELVEKVIESFRTGGLLSGEIRTSHLTKSIEVLDG